LVVFVRCVELESYSDFQVKQTPITIGLIVQDQDVMITKTTSVYNWRGCVR